MIGARRAARRSIRREIYRLLAESESKVLASQPVDEQVARIEKLEKLLELGAVPDNRTWIWASLIGCLCLAVSTFAAAWRVPSTRIQLDLKATSISFLLAGPIHWEGSWSVSPTLIRFQNVEHADLPDFQSPAWTGRVSFDVEVADVSTTVHASTAIRTLDARTGGSVSVDQSDQSVILAVRGAPTSVELNAAGIVKVSGHDTHSIEWKPDSVSFADVPADFGASGSGSSALPASLRIRPLGSITMRGILVSELSFLQEQLDAQQRPIAVSRIVSGSITLTDVGRKSPLPSGEMLRIKNGRGRLTLLEIEPTQTAVRFEGFADDVSTGQGDFLVDLRPSLLDFLFHQQRIGFIWGGLTTLWGLLWSARILILPSRAKG